MSTPTPRPVAAADAPTVLVLGATGLMGREVVRALRAHGVRPRVLVRDPARLAALVGTDGLDVRVGDLRDASSLRAALTGADVVFHISPHEADEVELTRTVIEACEAEGARLVFAGVAVTGRNALVRWVLRRVYGRLLPRYRGKMALARMVERSATDPVVLVPSNFMQTDEVLLDVIRDGLFVQPAHPKGLNRIDVRDIGDAAARILLDPSFPSGTHGLAGPRSLTGPECARVWSEALARPVRYAGDDDQAIEDALSRHLSGHRRDDWVSSFKALRGFAVIASADEIEGTERLLGRPPTDFTEFVARVVAEQGASVGRTG